MRAYVVEEKGVASVREVPIPSPGAGEVLIQVKAAGLCGTDAHIYGGDYFSTYPLIPGHEFAGTVTALGSGVKRFSVGERVAADPNVFCEKCAACQANRQNFCGDFQAVGVTRDGAFAEYVVVPVGSVFPIGNLDFTHAAMIEPLACVVYGQQRARPEVGAKVLIFGAGPIGLLHAQLATYNGASEVTVVDLNQERLAIAKEFSCITASQSNLPKAAFDLVIDSTGVPAVVEKAIDYVADGGSLLVFGVCPQESRIQISPYEIFRRDISIIGSFALRKTFGAALALLTSGKIAVEPLIGERVSLSQLPAAMERFVAGQGKMKLVVKP